MENHPAYLADYKSDVYSQYGEDGVIEKILSMLPQRDQWCVEFGAWDGVYLCNSRNLIQNKDYSAVLIEGNPVKFKELQKNYSQNSKVIPVNGFVGFSPQDNLDTILKKTPIPKDFDFLCIDIDGNDYHVWKAMEEYKPKLVCIEFNPSIPTEVSYAQPADPKINYGNSLLALVELAQEKGYELVSVLHINAFFVRKEHFQLFQISDNHPRILRKELNTITYLFVGYNGTVLLQGNRHLNWHNIAISDADVQILPAFLRKYPHDYNALERLLFKVFQAWKRLPVMLSYYRKRIFGN